MARYPERGMEARGSAREHHSPTAKVFVLVLCSVLISFHSLWSGQWVRFELKEDFPDVALSYWQYQQPASGKLYLKTSIQVGHKNLVFLKCTDPDAYGFIARYQLEVELQGKAQRDHHKVITDTIFTEDMGAFQELVETRLHQVEFPVEPGDYVFRLTLRDLNTHREAIYEDNIKVVGSDAQLAVSDLMLAHRVEMVDPGTGKYVFAVLPYPRAIFGILDPQLFYYFEIYASQSASGAPVSIELMLNGEQTGRQVVRHFRQPITRAKFPIFASLNTAEMAPGNYQLELIVRNAEENIVIQKVANFYVYQSPIDVRYRPYSDILDELYLIASSEEFRRLKNARPEERQKAIVEFWRAHDPNPATLKNELMTEFYRRVLIARRYFAVGNRLTDQARVFIKYGKPSKVIHYHFQDRRREMEVWVYPRLKFQAVFQDEFGFGEYHLVEPLSILSR